MESKNISFRQHHENILIFFNKHDDNMAKTFDPGSYLVPGPFFQQLQRLLREEGIVDQVAIHWRKKNVKTFPSLQLLNVEYQLA